MPTIKDVALKAKVSVGTVSLVLNNRPGPSQETRKNVHAVAEELHYLSKRQLKKITANNIKNVGLLVTDIENPFYGSITKYVNDFLSEKNYSMILSISNDDTYLETKVLHNFIQRGVKGILAVPTQETRASYEIFQDIKESGIPLVFLSSYYPKIAGKRVLTDYALGSYQLTKYLLDLGHRDIRFLVSCDSQIPIYFERVAGFMRAYREFNLSPSQHAIVQCSRPGFRAGFEMTSRILEDSRPDAVITINDIMAIGAKRAAFSHGLRVPEDISIAGYDDVIFASLSEIPLTTVRQNVKEMCRLSVEMLFDNDEVYSNEIRIRPELIVRSSTSKK